MGLYLGPLCPCIILDIEDIAHFGGRFTWGYLGKTLEPLAGASDVSDLQFLNSAAWVAIKAQVLRGEELPRVNRCPLGQLSVWWFHSKWANAFV